MKIKIFFLIALHLFILSCSNSDDNTEQKNASKDIYVTTTKSKVIEFTYQESAIGTLEGIIDPTVASEVSGKILKIRPDRRGPRQPRLEPPGRWLL